MLNWIVTWTDRLGNIRQAETEARTATEARARITPTAAYMDGARTAQGTATWTAEVGQSMRVYPSLDSADGIVRGALIVAYRTAINGIMRTGGNPTQWTIYRDARRITATALRNPTAAAIYGAEIDCGADVQDYISVATDALCAARNAGDDIATAYHTAYSALNDHIRGLRAAAAHELSTEYITDGGGDIVEYMDAIACIIRGGDAWTAAADDLGRLTAEDAAALGKVLHAALANCTPIQVRIVRLLAKDMSIRAIAKALRRNDKTIRRHIADVRAKVADAIRNDAPQFKRLLRAALIDRQTAAKKAEEKKNRHDAEYYRL